MKSPSRRTYIWGNPISLMAVLIGAGYVVLPWLKDPSTRGLDWVIPAIAVALAIKAILAAAYIGRYKRWRRATDALVAPPAENKTSGFLRYGFQSRLLIVLLILSMGCGWLVFSINPQHSDYQDLVMVFGGLILAAAAVGNNIYRARKKAYDRKPVSMSLDKSEHIVTVCLPKPSSSPSPRKLLGDLPDYCRVFFERP